MPSTTDALKFIEFIFTQDYTKLFLLVLLLIFVWLYKEIKQSLFDKKKSDFQFIDESITIYSKTLTYISYYLKSNDNDNEKLLLESFIELQKYSDENILIVINEFLLKNNSSTLGEKETILKNLMSSMIKKLNFLKKHQVYSTINKTSESFTESLSYLIIKSDLDLIFKPVLYISYIYFSSFFLFIFTIFPMIKYGDTDPLKVVVYLMILLTYYFLILLLLTSIDVISKRRDLLRKHYFFIFLYSFIFLSIAYVIKSVEYDLNKIIFLIVTFWGELLLLFKNIKDLNNNKTK